MAGGRPNSGREAAIHWPRCQRHRNGKPIDVVASPANLQLRWTPASDARLIKPRRNGSSGAATVTGKYWVTGDEADT